MQDRFKFRVPFFNNDDKFIGYDYCEMINGINAYNAGTCYKGYIQLSTGLKDKNGKLIFEGDIIEWKKEKHIVVFDERNATFGIKISDVETYLFNDIHTPTRWIEVIGNIYENKELLEEQK